ncbi:MAG: hypothetical protein PHU85_00420 [Phycisphaerae bacterium]|nr:hypothetical protein [Phycisphaerae bacterium]
MRSRPYLVALLLAGCATPASRYPQPVSPPTERAEARPARPTPQRWLFVHPSASGQYPHTGPASVVTGALVIAGPGGEPSLPAAIAPLHGYGWQVAAGRWVSQPNGTPAGRALLYLEAWHASEVAATLSGAGSADALVIDTEPYRDPEHWYPDADWEILCAATAPWQSVGARTLYILPGGPEYLLSLAIAYNARLGGATVILCDEWPYWCNAGVEAQRRVWATAQGYGYLPGYVLGALRDRRYMTRIAAGDCWFYPRADVDDLANFGGPNWRPGPLRPYVTGDCNCDGVADFGDLNPFVQYLSDLPGWQRKYPGCPAANGDADGDGTYPALRDINAFITIVQPPRKISGTVRTAEGLPLAGVWLSGLPGDPITDANGYYEASVPYGWSGTATPVYVGPASVEP